MSKEDIQDVIRAWVAKKLGRVADNDAVEKLVREVLAQFDFNSTTVPQAAQITEKVCNDFLAAAN